MNNNNKQWIFGIHSVENVIKKDSASISEIHICDESKNQRLVKLLALVKNKKIPFYHKTTQQLDARSPEKHQGVIALIETTVLHGEKQLKQDVKGWETPLLLVLDNIEDPRNLGACLRSADAAGVDAVILTKNKSAPITAIARKTAAGAVDNLAFYQVSNLSRALEIIKQAGIWVFGTDCSAESMSIYQADLKGAVALVMGNEGKGLRTLVKANCENLIHIPM
ncbi:MAG: 23S rRNA (guanosine(2251)-2'-O)-methyltransferase RlmB, partial [Proteobacteria bacterium]|nr:23S rRNA (guanosine(2251)-2'-O)-methyltransferase RlmB [Pseudomonadota bacterium]